MDDVELKALKIKFLIKFKMFKKPLKLYRTKLMMRILQ